MARFFFLVGFYIAVTWQLSSLCPFQTLFQPQASTWLGPPTFHKLAGSKLPHMKESKVPGGILYSKRWAACMSMTLITWSRTPLWYVKILRHSLIDCSLFWSNFKVIIIICKFSVVLNVLIDFKINHAFSL